MNKISAMIDAVSGLELAIEYMEELYEMKAEQDLPLFQILCHIKRIQEIKDTLKTHVDSSISI